MLIRKKLLIITMTCILAACKTATTAFSEMPPAERVTRVQENLISLGYMSGKPSGINDDATLAAITSARPKSA